MRAGFRSDRAGLKEILRVGFLVQQSHDKGRRKRIAGSDGVFHNRGNSRLLQNFISGHQHRSIRPARDDNHLKVEHRAEILGQLRQRMFRRQIAGSTDRRQLFIAELQDTRQWDGFADHRVIEERRSQVDIEDADNSRGMGRFHAAADCVS